MSRLIEAYRRLPVSAALLFSAVSSGFLGLLVGIAGAISAVYVYDRGMSKGDDLAVAIAGLLAAGTFTFVTMFTWMRKLHHAITWRTPVVSLGLCLVVAASVTVLMWDSGYSTLILLGWSAVSLSGLVAVFIALRWVDEDSGYWPWKSPEL